MHFLGREKREMPYGGAPESSASLGQYIHATSNNPEIDVRHINKCGCAERTRVRCTRGKRSGGEMLTPCSANRLHSSQPAAALRERIKLRRCFKTKSYIHIAMFFVVVLVDAKATGIAIAFLSTLLDAVCDALVSVSLTSVSFVTEAIAIDLVDVGSDRLNRLLRLQVKAPGWTFLCVVFNALAIAEHEVS